MQALRESGVVSSRGRVIQVANWEQLASVGEFDPDYLLLDEPSRPRRAEMNAPMIERVPIH